MLPEPTTVFADAQTGGNDALNSVVVVSFSSAVPLKIERPLHQYRARRDGRYGLARFGGKGTVPPRCGYRTGFHIQSTQMEQTRIPYREPRGWRRRHLS